MKNFIRIGVLAALCGSAVFAQDIAGDWKGTLKAGPAELRIVLHFTKAADGSLKATLDSVDQGANGIPVDAVTLKDSNLSLTVSAVSGGYEGKVNADATAIAGTWSQGAAIPLEFQRGTFAVVQRKSGKPSDIDGAWSGTLDSPAGSLRLIFRITNMEDGLMAFAEAPDRGIKGLPASSVSRDGAGLKLELKSIAAVFDGKISADLKTITGTFTQAGNGVPLLLTRE
jgi:hypothetical protein